MTVSVAQQFLWIGDDWTITVSVIDANRLPVNFITNGLTPGSEYFDGVSPTPTNYTPSMDSVNGKFTVTIPKSITANAPPMGINSTTSSTRLHAFVTDVQNKRTTIGVIEIIPLDPETAY